MTEEQNPTELLRQVREFVNDQLDAKEHPAQISFSLAYVAAELGFTLTDNSIAVIPVVLDAVSHAAGVMAEQAKQEAEEESVDAATERPVPRGKPNLTIVQ
jgi:hypothetical protein